jgi:hypothetical protein
VVVDVLPRLVWPRGEREAKSVVGEVVKVVPDHLGKQKTESGRVQAVDAVDATVVAVDGEPAASRHKQFLLFAVGMVRALPLGGDAENPIDTLDLERSLAEPFYDAQ